ncbi:hypothetical protein HAX54_033109 [Datura stramonium]|uniref:Uncharacterized protein n=1 Tax=Datura stramonium TaxID=4076 RepID=A0ABS8VEQ6_DATST|nr:hypothetical protein [Datura stramonium]
MDGDELFLKHTMRRDNVLLLLSVDEDQLTAAKMVAITCGLASFLPFLPYKYIGRDRFPVFISTENRSLFHAFVVFLMLSFATSFSALYLRSKYPKAAGFCKLCSITYLVSAVACVTFCFF